MSVGSGLGICFVGFQAGSPHVVLVGLELVI